MKDFMRAMLWSLSFLFNFIENQQIKEDRISVQVTGVITEPPNITKEMNLMVQNDFMDMY
jgi:hypothetical protein